MKQFKTYKYWITVPSEFLEYGYYEFGGVRTPCINISDIDATSDEILCLINNHYKANGSADLVGRFEWFIYMLNKLCKLIYTYNGRYHPKSC